MTCDQCHKRLRGKPHETMTGRRLCDDCYATLQGLTVGMASSGGNVGTSISIAGWYKGLRKKRRT
jgi:hypothetical protein